MNKKQKIHNKDDWGSFAIGYLSIAELAFLEILNRKHNENNSDFDAQDIYIPALFNLKHGIEVLLKALGIEFLNKDILDQSDYSHDIDEIFKKLRDRIKEDRLMNGIKKVKEKHPNTEKIFGDKSIFDELERLVHKYQGLDFLKKRIGVNYSIEDTENTAFKYPTNNLNIQINYQDLIKSFEKGDIQESLEDCMKLENIFFQLYLILFSERSS